jgi:hypothetical protein
MTLDTVASPVETEERLAGESMSAYTDRLARLGSERGVYRQCSIGWHYECSDPRGQKCRCNCHPERERTRALPLPENDGYYVDRDGDAWHLSEGTWWFGSDGEQDPRDSAPFVRLYALTPEQLQLHLDALSTAAWVNHHVKPERETEFEHEWKRMQGEGA